MPDSHISSIGERFQQLRSSRKISQSDLASRLDITQGALSHIENGRINPSFEVVQRCCKFFGVSADHLLFGGTANITRAHAGETGEYCLLVNKSAQADYPNKHRDDPYIKGLARYKIPGFESPHYRIFEICGDSMEPTLFEGEYVVTEKIRDYTHIKNHQLYVLVSKKGVLAKRLFLYEDGMDVVVISSDNSEYEERTMRAGDILEIWKVRGKVTAMVDTNSQASYDDLEKRILALEKIMHEKLMKKKR